MRFVSGGQTGIDRGMLDACLEKGFACGGWCPEGRLAEDGPIDEKYPLKVLPNAGYPERTRENVIDSDATLIFFNGELAGGTKKSKTLARSLGKPYLMLDFSETDLESAVDLAYESIKEQGLQKINFSGPRASNWPEAHEIAYEFTSRLIDRFRGKA
ncbi:MAG TPA: putative molybdenum carrier protein [Planctomycetaceae bacterium]|nr:putative molybdenum carrier protein [Planctomycetaceae bacterium]